MALSLTFACEDYEWFEPIVHGAVEPDGVDLDVTATESGGERHRRTIAGEYDVAEFSLGTYITGWPDWPFTAIPAFPRRFFPQSRIVVREDAAIDEPTDLEGRRVLVLTYQNTHALWTKGVLADHYDVDLDAVEWHALNEEPVPVDVPVSGRCPDRETAYRRIAAGDLDALVLTKTAELYPLRENTTRLFDDPVATERAYYEETGLYPTMHNVVVRDELLEAHPWLPGELLETFRRSQAVAAERGSYGAKYPLVWWQQYREQELAEFGDVWGRSFEFAANEAELRTMIGHAHDQGLIEEPFDAAEMFAYVD